MENILIGTAGFSFKDWEGVVYPKDLKKRKVHPLAYYAQFYDCCEINTSFYGHIRPQYAQQWCSFVEESNPRFLFTAKLNKNLSQPSLETMQEALLGNSLRLDRVETAAKAGFNALAERERLGAVLMQFPLWFKNAPVTRDYLTLLIEKFRAYPLAIELRNESWNDPAVLSSFTQRGVAFCNIDQPRIDSSLRDTTHVTAPLGYVRLHAHTYSPWFAENTAKEKGKENSDYLHTSEQLQQWKQRILAIGAATQRTFVLANNHPNGQSAANALELKAMIAGRAVPVPPTLVAAYPHLEELRAAADYADERG